MPTVTQTGLAANDHTPFRVRSIASVSSLVGGSTSACTLFENTLRLKDIPVRTSTTRRLVLRGRMLFTSDHSINSTAGLMPSKSDLIYPLPKLVLTLDHPLDSFANTSIVVFFGRSFTTLVDVEGPSRRFISPVVFTVAIGCSTFPVGEIKSDLIKPFVPL